MTAPALALVVIGSATVTSWLFKVVDAIEAPRKGGSHNVDL